MLWLSTLAGLCTADAKTKSPDAVWPQSDCLPGIPDPMALFRIWFMILVDLGNVRRRVCLAGRLVVGRLIAGKREDRCKATSRPDVRIYIVHLKEVEMQKTPKACSNLSHKSDPRGTIGTCTTRTGGHTY